MSTCPKIVNYSFDSERVAEGMKGSKTLIWAGIVISKTTRHHGSAWVALKARTKQCFKVSLKATLHCWFSTYPELRAGIHVKRICTIWRVYNYVTVYYWELQSSSALAKWHFMSGKYQNNKPVLIYNNYASKYRFSANSCNSCIQGHRLIECMIFESCLIAEFEPCEKLKRILQVDAKCGILFSTFVSFVFSWLSIYSSLLTAWMQERFF